MTNQELLQLAVDASVAGAKRILEVYSQDFSVEFKQDQSPLTLADRLSHEAIHGMLAGTGYPVLSEEGKHLPYEIRKTWKRFWLVDPLDGTKEFVKRNGEFTVNIALIDEGVPVIGVILVPVTMMLYFAGAGQGAFKTRLRTLEAGAGGQMIPERLPSSKALQRTGYAVVCSRSHMSPETVEYIEKLKPLHPGMEFVSVGSSLKLCLVAEGNADVYPRFGPTMEWDTAAGHAIVEISGGKVLKADGSGPLRYNKENLLNPWFIASRE